ncbi:hypothetical protein Naga_100001g196 [Nannochloropsis gaditana]|uniref:Uncharacterized protein n=1 Tax=Nannochloropsis gaditana TaxID=72520 RepID=W7TKS3_9STRA|nr:hypothetical protein Naga_100001g196 [Nannochloropsis gaditana]
MVAATLDRNIWICASDGDLSGVKEFLDDGGLDVNSADEFGYTCLHAASSYGHVELIQFLVGRGGDVDVRDPDGDTPLHVCEDVAAAEALVTHGADPQARNNQGKRPHDVALEEGHVAVAGYLRPLCGLPPLSTEQMQRAMVAVDQASNDVENGGDVCAENCTATLADLEAFIASSGREEEGKEADDKESEDAMEETNMAE